MYEVKRHAYQVQGIVRYLCDVLDWDFSEASALCEDCDIDTIRYHYRIPDEDINKYWYMALGVR